jgi:hypothetical protein
MFSMALSAALRVGLKRADDVVSTHKGARKWGIKLVIILAITSQRHLLKLLIYLSFIPILAASLHPLYILRKSLNATRAALSDGAG